MNSEECSGSVKSCTGWKRIKKIVLLVADVNYGVPKYTECAGNEPDVMLLGNAQEVLEEDQQICSFGLRYNYGIPMCALGIVRTLFGSRIQKSYIMVTMVPDSACVCSISGTVQVMLRMSWI